MYSHNPIDILNNGRSNLIEERTLIELKLKTIQKQITEINQAIGEYDFLIDQAKTIHEPEQIQEKLPEFEFVESEKTAIKPNKCTFVLNDLTYGRDGDQITIRTVTGKCINSTWDYLVDFYERLPDETRYNQVTGINKDKRFTLMKFYESHVNFPCKIVPDPDGKSKMLVKEAVIVNNDTQPLQKVIDVI